MQLDDNLVYFLDEARFRETDRDGFRRRVITGEHLQLVFWRIKGGSTGSVLHHHVANEQLGIVVRGRLNFRISEDKDAEDRIELGPGEEYLGPIGVCTAGAGCLCV